MTPWIFGIHHLLVGRGVRCRTLPAWLWRPAHPAKVAPVPLPLESCQRCVHRVKSALRLRGCAHATTTAGAGILPSSQRLIARTDRKTCLLNARREFDLAIRLLKRILPLTRANLRKQH